MSFALSVDGGALEWGSRGLGAVFAQRSNLLRPSFWRMIYDVVRFGKACLEVSSDRTSFAGPWSMARARAAVAAAELIVYLNDFTHAWLPACQPHVAFPDRSHFCLPIGMPFACSGGAAGKRGPLRACELGRVSAQQRLQRRVHPQLYSADVRRRLEHAQLEGDPRPTDYFVLHPAYCTWEPHPLCTLFRPHLNLWTLSMPVVWCVAQTGSRMQILLGLQKLRSSRARAVAADNGVSCGEPGPLLGQSPSAGFNSAACLACREGAISAVRAENHCRHVSTATALLRIEIRPSGLSLMTDPVLALVLPVILPALAIHRSLC